MSAGILLLKKLNGHSKSHARSGRHGSCTSILWLRRDTCEAVASFSTELQATDGPLFLILKIQNANRASGNPTNNYLRN